MTTDHKFPSDTYPVHACIYDVCCWNGYSCEDKPYTCHNDHQDEPGVLVPRIVGS